MSGKIKLSTADEVIDFAGGTTKVAKRFGVSVEAVCAWRKHGLPANRTDQWRRILSELKAEAPASLFGQK